MSGRLRLLSLVLFALLSLFMIWFGATYLLVMGMLWFHAAAVPEAVRPEIAELYDALMNLIGGSSLGLGALGLYLTFGPIRQNVPGAASAYALALLIPFAIAGYTAEKLAAATGAPVASTNMIILSVITAIALITHTVQARAGMARSISTRIADDSAMVPKE